MVLLLSIFAFVMFFCHFKMNKSTIDATFHTQQKHSEIKFKYLYRVIVIRLHGNIIAVKCP